MPKPKSGKRRLFRRRLPRTLRIRPLRRADLPDLARLFHDTVRRIDRRDYAAPKLRAWSPRVRPAAFWRQRLQGRQGFGALAKRKLVGFASLGPQGAINLLYVQRKRQGRGVGRALVERLTAEARRQRIGCLTADASIAARPFFEALGFRRVLTRLRHVGGRALRQYRMERRLNGSRPRRRTRAG